MKRDKISSSMSIVYVMHKDEVELFWKDLNELKEVQGSSFFLYIEEQRPEIDCEDGIIELNLEDAK